MSELIRTQLGLVDPSTGTLVKSIRGLSNIRKWNKETNEFNPPLTPPKKEVAPAPVQTAPKPAKKTAAKTAKKTTKE